MNRFCYLILIIIGRFFDTQTAPARLQYDDTLKNHDFLKKVI